VKVNNLPTRKMLEASYIHKHKGTYYFSYSTGWQQGAPTIDYGISNNVMGPYTWKGTILGDPSMNGRSINGNNNHHGIAEFKGHSYVVYHDRRIAKGHNGLEIIPADDGVAKPNEGYHRSVSVDEMFYNADGTIKTVTVTDEGPAQIENFDPYDWYPALTSSKQKGIRSRSNFVQGKAADHVLLPLSSKEAWLRVSGVDFGAGATGFTVEAASAADGNKIEIRSGSATGTLAGTCTLKNTGNKSVFAENKCDVEGLSGVVKQLFLVFKGSKDSTMAVKAWGFEGSGTTPPEPQKPFSGKAWDIPGKIEMEDFDIPGSGRGSEIKSYSENDSEDHGIEEGGKSYREGTGVDIYKKATGYVVGYNQSGEWLEYTVNVKEEGDYTMFASVATDNSTASFTLSIDDKSIAEVPVSGDSWNDFVKVKANVTLPAGEHVLRFTITGDWFDIDYMQFAKGKDAKDPDDETIAIKGFRVLGADEVANFDVFDLTGKKVTSFTARNIHEAKKLWRDNPQSQNVQGVCIIRNRHNGAVARVRTTR
jgi:hypothetical protein